MEDTITPFIIGLLEFAMVDLMGPETLGPWFLVLAAVFTVSIGASHLVMRRARRDSANDYFFGQVARASWRDYAGSIVVVLLLALCGVALWVSGRGDALAAAALLFALVALIVQLMAIHRYWLVMPEVVKPQDTTG
ncbi:MAG: hypothetical protein IMF06_15590 [Proteobacteria bacterium]|nr:hypothetical protein [Pseudomonadota bacterium]